MPNKPSNWKELALLRELRQAAEIIDSWTPSQRKAYLKELLQREKTEGRTLSRTLVRIILTDSKGRKNFIKLFKKGKI